MFKALSPCMGIFGSILIVIVLYRVICSIVIRAFFTLDKTRRPQ